MKLNWTSKTIIILLIALAGFFGQQKFRQYRLQTAIETEKQKLLNQLNALEGKNTELHQTLGYLNSKNYKETIARQQLNMQKEGELVYSFSEPPDEGISSDNYIETQTSNFQKWVNYFLNEPDKAGE